MQVGDIVVIDNTRYGSVQSFEHMVTAIRPNNEQPIFVHRGSFLILQLESCPPGYLENSPHWVLALNIERKNKLFLYRGELEKYVDSTLSL